MDSSASEMDPEARPRKPRKPGIDRRRVWFNVVVQLVLLLAVVLLANYLGFRHHERWDMTRNERFTLSGTSQSFVESLREDVEIVVAFAGSSMVSEDVKILADEYGRMGGDRIQVSHLDPVREPDRASEIKSRFGISLDRNSVIIARGEQVRVVTEGDMVEVDEKKEIVTSFFGEVAITRGLIAVVEEEPRQLYLLEGHQQAEFLRAVLTELSELGARYNIRVGTHSLVDPVPEDADALLLVSPQTDLAADEMSNLVRWWAQDRAAFMVTLDANADTPLLDLFLRRHGLAARGDRVLYAERALGQPTRKVYTVSTLIRPGTVVTRGMGGLSFNLEGQSRSMELFSSDLIQEENIHLTPLLVADPRYWGETDYEAPDVRRDRNRDFHAPLYLGAMVERGAVDDPNLSVETQRMVVISNPQLLTSGESRQKVKSDFSLACLNWLMDRTELIGVTPREPTRYVVELTNEERNLIERLIFYVFPGLALGMGVLVWIARRN